MHNKHKWLWLTVMMLIVVLALSACSSDDEVGSTEGGQEFLAYSAPYVS